MCQGPAFDRLKIGEHNDANLFLRVTLDDAGESRYSTAVIVENPAESPRDDHSIAIVAGKGRRLRIFLEHLTKRIRRKQLSIGERPAPTVHVFDGRIDSAGCEGNAHVNELGVDEMSIFGLVAGGPVVEDVGSFVVPGVHHSERPEDIAGQEGIKTLS